MARVKAKKKLGLGKRYMRLVRETSSARHASRRGQWKALKQAGKRTFRGIRGAGRGYMKLVRDTSDARTKATKKKFKAWGRFFRGK